MSRAMHHESQNVTDYPNNNTIFTVWKFKEGAEIKPVFEQLCGLVANLNHTFIIRAPGGRATCVMGVGYEAWLKLSLPRPIPKELRNFEPVAGAKHTAVATPGDLHFHLRSTDMSICFDMLTAITAVLSPVADCLEEVHGFRYWDGRSILGFVDGTENPIGNERQHFALVGDEDPVYKGGSYLFVQKYLHNMNGWTKLSTEDQEKVIGRYKISDIEMPDDVKPDNSHSALASLDDDNGNELKIVRDNMPFGNPGKNEVGTYFIAYANTFSTTFKMLERMFIGVPAGNYDRILDFSTAHTGSLFFAPSMDMLKQYTADGAA
ncbi:Dyp-type peroxidase [Chitinophaga ginsengisegetis]|uniref:Dyp-type peroxidase n=1 Tax=Chitinophaga ginsengisegetis TaxID=393003 RepID=UPI001D05AFEC|nr:Dyp-type peroxidase [Chitinophaga ginsengisegetis]MDR6570685.1 putative iron-dependent peroxidase [Chitinophaga ginsengisegetis]MDR6650419.1 putative iron-dependent peroxidase [Chitinophaga ginsengisegetis]MDR6656942.1 putative iron-dependent peroxidase [Chitinophaga ginsengisegetis]